MSAPERPLRDYFRLEWRHAPWRHAAIMSVVAVLVVIGSHAIMPLFPERAILLMQRGFRLKDLAGVLVLNDLMGVYFPTFLFGLSSSLRIVLGPREEKRLEILLAKPVRPSTIVAARALPVLVMTLLVGVLASATCAVALALHRGAAGTSVSPAGAFGGGLVFTGMAIVLLGALQILFVRIRDPFLGLLVACFAWLATVMPGAVLLYRPDVFEGREHLLNLLVMTSLVWHDDVTARIGPIALVASIPLALLAVRAAGALLERSDSA